MTIFRLARSPVAHISGLTRSLGTLSYTASPPPVPVGDYWDVPSLQDEIDFYANSDKPGGVWAWTTSDRNFDFAVGPLAALAPTRFNVHNEFENDDLWTWQQHVLRGYTNPLLVTDATQRGIVTTWSDRWLEYYRGDGNTSSYYTRMITNDAQGDWTAASGRFCHVFVKGLCLLGVKNGDTAAISMAKKVMDHALATEYPLGIGEGDSQNKLSALGEVNRPLARLALACCHLAEATGEQKWTDYLDVFIARFMATSFTNWREAPAEGIVQGGFYHITTTDLANTGNNWYGYTLAMYNAGIRAHQTFYFGIFAMVLIAMYRHTGRADIRDRIILFARYAQYYGVDPAYTVPLAGQTFGNNPDGTHFHTQADTTGTATYDACLVDLLVWGYKFTGDTALLARAKLHFRQCSKWVQGGPGNLTPATPENEVRQFVDTRHDPTGGSDTALFYNNKGHLQYVSYLFENGGHPAVEGSAPWSPPYPVPENQYEAIHVGGYTAHGSQWGTGTPGVTTNDEKDVRPTEVGNYSTNMWTNGDSGTMFIHSFSPAGAIVQAGGGGHHGTNSMGGIVFDLTDLLFKRIWTTQGDPGVDNITNKPVDVRSGTRIHNCLNYADDLVGDYTNNHDSICWYKPHWTPTGTEFANVPYTADPSQQTWEVTRAEPAAWNGDPVNGHGWQYPGTWLGLHGFKRMGYVGRVPGKRFDPTPEGTLAPTQSGLPAPGHCWYYYYEVTPAQGGGPKGSIAFARSIYQTHSSGANLQWSHRFDLHTGIWHEDSINYSTGGGTSPVGGGLPATLAGATAGCYDPVKERMFIIPSSPGNRINYMNMSDRTWRNFATATPTAIAGNLSESCAIDPVRRLMIIQQSADPKLRALDINTLLPEPNPTSCQGGWRAINLTIDPACQEGWDGVYMFQLNDPTDIQRRGGAKNYYNRRWVYCEEDGCFYRPSYHNPFVGPQGLNSSNRWKATTGSAYWGIAPNELGPYVGSGMPVGTFDRIQKLTPPPIIASPPDYYYIDQPWTWTEIRVTGTPMQRPSYHSQEASCGADRFWYVPKLKCFVWMPLNQGGGESPATRYGVWLIKV